MKKIFLFIALVSQSIHPIQICPGIKAAIFDLGGVIFDQDQKKFAQYLGVQALPSHVYPAAFQLLRDMRKEKPITSSHNIPMASGMAMPEIMIEWQKGLISGKQVLEEIKNFLAKHTSYFAKIPDEKLVHGALNKMFDAPLRMKFTTVIADGVALLEWFVSRGYKAYALTNMDSETLELSRKNYPAIFKNFAAVFSSSEMHVLKPSVESFQYLLHATGLKPEQCYFFDDQEENITAARKLGFYACKATAQTLPKLLSATALQSHL